MCNCDHETGYICGVHIRNSNVCRSSVKVGSTAIYCYRMAKHRGLHRRRGVGENKFQLTWKGS